MVEGVSIDIVEGGNLETVLVHNVHKLAKSTHVMHSLRRQVVSSTPIITPIAAFFKKHVDKRVEVRFKKALEHPLSKERADSGFTAPFGLRVTQIQA